jgi:hypothetical protein
MDRLPRERELTALATVQPHKKEGVAPSLPLDLLSNAHRTKRAMESRSDRSGRIRGRKQRRTRNDMLQENVIAGRHQAYEEPKERILHP